MRQRAAMRSGPSLLLVLAALSVVACTTDPVHDAEVDALGPEAPGVPKGPYHRAGQPCGVCHSGRGPAHTVFSVAGTVFAFAYAADAGLEGVGGVAVNVQDDLGSPCLAMTNCVGNFYMQPNASINPCDPEFPVWVGVAPSPTSQNTQWMTGHVGRDSSCAGCHSDPSTPSSPGHVYFGTTADAGSCPVNPVLSAPPPAAPAGGGM
jgi:hypothetical protein